jgi:hypothetical protein
MFLKLDVLLERIEFIGIVEHGIGTVNRQTMGPRPTTPQGFSRLLRYFYAIGFMAGSKAHSV